MEQRFQYSFSLFQIRLVADHHLDLQFPLVLRCHIHNAGIGNVSVWYGNPSVVHGRECGIKQINFHHGPFLAVGVLYNVVSHCKGP